MSGFTGMREVQPPVAAPESVPEAPVHPARPEPPADAPARLRAALKAIRWTYGDLAVALGLSPSTTRNWGLGRGPVPGDVLIWVEVLAQCHRNAPKPGGFRGAP